jgi:hypothetical protein
VATILKKFELENDTLNQAELNEIKIKRAIKKKEQ